MKLKLTEKDRHLLAIAPAAIQWVIFVFLLFITVSELAGGGELGGWLAVIAVTIASLINVWYIGRQERKDKENENKANHKT